MNNYFLTIVLVAAIACSNEPFENDPNPREPHFDLKNECKNIGKSTSDFGFSTQILGTQYGQPRYNPHDADEFVYHERSDNFSRMVKYRISTEEKTVLIDPAPRVVEIDWGRAGWIAFSNYQDMHLMREDGSGLYKVPLPSYETGYSCAEPDFNPDGTLVGFPFGGVDRIGLYGMYLLYNLETQTLDTLNSYETKLNFVRPLDWSITDKINRSFKNENNESIGLGYLDYRTGEIELIFKHEDRKWLDGRLGSGDVCWNSIGDQVYHTGGNIISYPLNEYQEIRIKKGCASRYYEDITISPDDQHIVVKRVDVKRSAFLSNTLEKRERLFIMDIDGCNERLLLGDE